MLNGTGLLVIVNVRFATQFVVVFVTRKKKSPAPPIISVSGVVYGTAVANASVSVFPAGNDVHSMSYVDPNPGSIVFVAVIVTRPSKFPSQAVFAWMLWLNIGASLLSPISTFIGADEQPAPGDPRARVATT